MKKLSLLCTFLTFVLFGAANAANVTVYYSPACPHCHHAREFISNTLVYEYPTITVTEVNVTKSENSEKFRETLTKCEYTSGGVPVLVIGEKCFQGYADFMQQDLRDAVGADLSDAERATAAENKKALEADAEKFKSEHSDRASAISEYQAPTPDVAKNKLDADKTSYLFYGLLIVLVAALGFILIRKDKKK